MLFAYYGNYFARMLYDKQYFFAFYLPGKEYFLNKKAEFS